MIASHKGLQWPEEYSEQFLDNPRYFSSLLIFCEAQGIPFSKYLRELIGTEGKLPKLTDSWLETLLQGFLFDDADSYQILEGQRQQILAELKEAGCISRKKVSLTQKEAHGKAAGKKSGKAGQHPKNYRNRVSGAGIGAAAADPVRFYQER